MERWWTSRNWTDFVHALRSIATHLKDMRAKKETRIVSVPVADATDSIAEHEDAGWTFVDADAVVGSNGSAAVVLTFQRPVAKS